MIILLKILTHFLNKYIIIYNIVFHYKTKNKIKIFLHTILLQAFLL